MDFELSERSWKGGRKYGEWVSVSLSENERRQVKQKQEMQVKDFCFKRKFNSTFHCS